MYKIHSTTVHRTSQSCSCRPSIVSALLRSLDSQLTDPVVLKCLNPIGVAKHHIQCFLNLLVLKMVTSNKIRKRRHSVHIAPPCTNPHLHLSPPLLPSDIPIPPRQIPLRPPLPQLQIRHSNTRRLQRRDRRHWCGSWRCAAVVDPIAAVDGDVAVGGVFAHVEVLLDEGGTEFDGLMEEGGSGEGEGEEEEEGEDRGPKYGFHCRVEGCVEGSGLQRGTEWVEVLVDESECHWCR